MNCKRKSRRRLFLLTRSRVPPISSEFRGRGGLNTPTPLPRYATDRKYTSFLNVLYFIHFRSNIRCNVRAITQTNNHLLLARTAIIAQRLCRTKCVGRRHRAMRRDRLCLSWSTIQRWRHRNRHHSLHISRTGLMAISEKGRPNDALIPQMGEIPVLIIQLLAYYFTWSGNIGDITRRTTKESWFGSREG